MRSLGLILFSLLVFTVSCDEKEPQAPDYLITEEKMVEIMVDMHLVETAHNL